MIFRTALAGIATALVAVGATAAPLLYTNVACGACLIPSQDTTTGARVGTFTQDKGNGRGVVVVGDNIFYTTANSGNVFKRSVSSNADLGIAFNVAGSSGLQAISFDGTDFWVGDYSGTTKAYKYSITGTLLSTITLNNGLATGAGAIEGFYDGLEYFNGKLIANRYDGGFKRASGQQYDIYNLDGTISQLGFINTLGQGNGTGIAFDGTDFFVSDIGNSRATRWSGLTGAFLGAINLGGGGLSNIEDLSVDFAGRVDTCGKPGQPPCIGTVPTPGTLPLVVLALCGVGAMLKRRRG